MQTVHSNLRSLQLKWGDAFTEGNSWHYTCLYSTILKDLST